MSQVKPSSIFIVEDDADNLFIALELLRRTGGQQDVRSLTSGEAFFELVETEPERIPDLILLDIQLPGGDGYEVLDYIRRHPRLALVWVVAFTANVTTQNIARAQAAGFDGFIGKPVAFQRFPQQIQRLLRGERVWEPR